jgi:hypothetical protein
MVKGAVGTGVDAGAGVVAADCTHTWISALAGGPVIATAADRPRASFFIPLLNMDCPPENGRSQSAVRR